MAADVIVVGAGAAGLMAARELKRAGKDVLVLEANSRIGGRIFTLYRTTAGLPVELGAEFIHGDAPETTRLLDEARLVTFPVLGKHYRSDRGEISPQGPIWQRMGLVFKQLNPDRRNDRSFQDFLDTKPGGPQLRAERELARGFIQGFNAADPSLASEKSIAQQGDPTEGASEARRIVNGYAALIEYLHKDLADVIRLNVRVKRITWNESSARLSDQNDKDYSARYVIITVPLPMLEAVSITFDPEIPSMRRAASQLIMGHVTRVNVVVKERFWEKKVDELSYMHTPTRPFNVWWTQHPMQAPLLTGWAGGPPSVELTNSGDVEGAAIRELARLFSTKRNRLEALVDSIHVHDWTLDPHFRGAYAYPGVGGAYAARTLGRSVSGTVFIAGEATDTGSGGTVEAAIASGKRAARRILEGATS